MPGIKLTHATARSVVVTVPIPSKPLLGQSRKICPTCHIIHELKNVHLWLDDTGSVVVSEGVLEDLRAAGLPDLTVGETIENPPTLVVNKIREEQDYANRTTTVAGGVVLQNPPPGRVTDG